MVKSFGYKIQTGPPGHLPLWLSHCPPVLNGLSDFASAFPFYQPFFLFCFNIYIHKDALSAFVIAHTLEGIMMNSDTLHFEQTDSRETRIRRNPDREGASSKYRLQQLLTRTGLTLDYS